MTKVTCEHSGVEWDTDFPMKPRLPHSSDGNYLVAAWISVKDQLPANYHEVFFYLIRDECMPEFVIGHRVDDIWYACRFLESIELNNDPKILNVTHWMELPAHPRGNE